MNLPNTHVLASGIPNRYAEVTISLGQEESLLMTV